MIGENLEASYIYLTCRRSSVSALKEEMSRRFPDYRISFSKAGFLTYKLPQPLDLTSSRLPSAASMKLTFPRSFSFALGTIRGENADEMAAEFWNLISRKFSLDETNSLLVKGLHVWEPDGIAKFQKNEFEPEVTPEAKKTEKLLRTVKPNQIAIGNESGVSAQKNNNALNPFPHCYLDCVLLSPKEWWVGIHQETDFHSRYPGGLIPLRTAEDAVSRAWLKFEEGIRWSEFPIVCGSRCADIGASPGGGSQALLARGAEVLGVDPAAMAPELLKNPNFKHLRGRIGQLKKSHFQKVRWVIADMNVAPNYTLEVLGDLIQTSSDSIRGMIFTLKLFDLDLAKNIQSYAKTIKGWGFNRVKIRQLIFNKQEIMVAALKKPFNAKR